jgi:peroxiredoxin
MTLHFPLPALLSLAVLSAGCGQAVKEPTVELLTPGAWRLVLDLDSTVGNKPLPFQFDLAHNGAGWKMTVHNQAEAIAVDSVVVRGDSFLVRMPFFDSEFRGVIQDPKTITGLWYNHYKGPDYAIPFTATAGVALRFQGHAATPPPAISGDWEAHFVTDKDDEPAIGMFQVNGNTVTGTFATETGDLRFLDGMANADSLFLSTFNGSQAYLFEAAFRHDSIIGEFHSGHRWKQRWYAVRNPDFKLGNDETLTQLDPKQPVAFSFPSAEGGMRSLSDDRYEGKVVVVEIMGTWCPNCLDESRMLNELYGRYHDSGLGMLALAFERYPSEAASMASIRHFHDKLGLGYDILYAGRANADSVMAKLPFIAHFMSYPTTLLIGRDGTVRHIYTGIYGPGTGARYVQFKERMENAIVDLLREKPKS